MARLVLASVLAAAEAGTLAVTCLPDEDVTSAHFTATVTALGSKVSECSGDGTKDFVCNLPMGVGKITLKALSFPIAKGTVSIPIEVEISGAIPASLANVGVHVSAEDQNGESIICRDVHPFEERVQGGTLAVGARSPGDGCCLDTSHGFSLTQSYPLQLDEMYDKIPEGAKCDGEFSGTEAISADGKMYQDMTATCLVSDPDDEITYRSVNLVLPNGTDLDANIIYHANGTFEANCHFWRARLSAPLQDDDICYGPKYHDDQVFVGNVTYGSLRAERYRNGEGRGEGNIMDLDVDNGCIPIRQIPITLTNWLNAAPESLFAIPPECFQQSAKATGPLTLPKSLLPSLKARRSSSVV